MRMMIMQTMGCARLAVRCRGGQRCRMTAASLGLVVAAIVAHRRPVRANRQIGRREGFYLGGGVDDPSKPSRNRVPFHRLEWAEEYLHAHLDKKPSHRDSVKIAHMSPYHLVRAFKAYFGEPPYRYLQRLHLNKAIALLTQTRMLLAGITAKVGFS